MAILAIFSAKDMTKDMYDTLVKEVRWAEDHPKGGIFHAAAFDDTGAHVADVWASQQDLDAFVGSRLMPVFQKHNIPAPDVVVYPIHNINVYPEIDQYKVK